MEEKESLQQKYEEEKVSSNHAETIWITHIISFHRKRTRHANKTWMFWWINSKWATILLGRNMQGGQDFTRGWGRRRRMVQGGQVNSLVLNRDKSYQVDQWKSDIEVGDLYHFMHVCVHSTHIWIIAIAKRCSRGTWYTERDIEAKGSCSKGPRPRAERKGAHHPGERPPTCWKRSWNRQAQGT